MQLPTFKLEEFLKKYEFSTPYVLCSSEAEQWSLKEILELADGECRELWDNLILGYTESSGHPLLRQEIAQLYSTIDPDRVVTFAGAEEGIYCALRTLIEPGDHVITLAPCYQSLGSLPAAFGAEVTHIPLRAENGWQLELEALERAFRPETKLLLLNYPHNPTGTLLNREVFERMIKLARSRGAYIFCDEVYRYTEIEESTRLPSIADAYEKGIAINVMTKSFGLAGVRIGWLAAQETLILQKAASYKLYTSICNSGPSEILAIIALRAKEKLLQRNRQIVQENLNQLHAFMQRHQNILAWTPPQSGNITLVELLLPIPIEEFTEQLVEAMGVLIMPGSMFAIPGNFFRVGFGKRSMKIALERFEQFLQGFAK